MLRKSPTRTEAFLAANRRNALKCTGPRTPEGKARSSLNGLRNGRYVQGLREKLETAGLRSGRALYDQIRSEIITTFKVEDPLELKQVDRVATMVWCLAWRAGIFGTKPRSPLFPSASSPLYFQRPPARSRMKNHWLRIGLAYWVQRRRYWTTKRFYKDLATGEPTPVPTVPQPSTQVEDGHCGWDGPGS